VIQELQVVLLDICNNAGEWTQAQSPRRRTKSKIAMLNIIVQVYISGR